MDGSVISKRIVVSMLLLSTFVCGASTFAYDGHTLLRNCNHYLNSADPEKADSIIAAVGTGYCLGMVEGVAITFYNLGRMGVEGLPSCPPDDMKTPQLISVVVNFLEENSDRLNAPVAILIMFALMEAYPCE
jgi:hypothetical protein